jgi:hypothetical protein
MAITDQHLQELGDGLLGYKPSKKDWQDTNITRYAQYHIQLSQSSVDLIDNISF